METKTGKSSVSCSFSAALTWQDRIRVIVLYFPWGHNADTTAHDTRHIWDRITVKEYERENVADIQNNRKSSIWRCSSLYYYIFKVLRQSQTFILLNYIWQNSSLYILYHLWNALQCVCIWMTKQKESVILKHNAFCFVWWKSICVVWIAGVKSM